MLENFTYDGKKRLPFPKLSTTIWKIPQIFVTSLLSVDVINDDLSSSVYVKEWIIMFIVSKLILVCFTWFVHDFAKGALSGLRQFLANESPLKIMKNAFYFISKALFVLKIFEFLS